MFRYLFLAGLLFIAPLAASAQVLIIGGGAGEDCYRTVRLNMFPSRSDEKVCSDAIETGALDRVNLAGTLINRGIIRMRRGDFESSLADYARAERLVPDKGALYLNRGAALIGTGQYEEALTALNRALELETQDPQSAHYNLGVAHELLGQNEPAYRSYQTALELKPEWSLPTKALERFTVIQQ